MQGVFVFVCLFVCWQIPKPNLRWGLFVSQGGCLVDFKKRKHAGFPGIPSRSLCWGDRPEHQRRAFPAQKYQKRLLVYFYVCHFVKTVEFRGHQHFMTNFHDHYPLLGTGYFSRLIAVMFCCLIFLYSRMPTIQIPQTQAKVKMKNWTLRKLTKMILGQESLW